MGTIVGSEAPKFSLPSTKGSIVSLDDYLGKNIVLYFYPKDMTPGCTTQACDFRDRMDDYSNLDTVILGVSPDPIQRHNTFIEKHNLPFELLADVDKEVAKKYNVWQLKKTFGKEYMGIVRSTFVIDKEGILVKEWRNIRVKGHVDDVFNFVKTLN